MITLEQGTSLSMPNVKISQEKFQYIRLGNRKFFTFPKYRVLNIELWMDSKFECGLLLLFFCVYVCFLFFLPTSLPPSSPSFLSFLNLDILTQVAGIENTEGMSFCKLAVTYYHCTLKISGRSWRNRGRTEVFA